MADVGAAAGGTPMEGMVGGAFPAGGIAGDDRPAPRGGGVSSAAPVQAAKRATDASHSLVVDQGMPA
jgi:hypothetical protein